MTKEEIRKAVWNLLRRTGTLRFPGAQARIPNFAEAERAASLLSELAVWRRARAVKVSLDAPQLFVRRRAIADGKVLYVTLPNLRAERCFVELDPDSPHARETLGASLAAACRHGRLVAPRDMRPIDLIVCGSVAVSRTGTRVGKGGGYVDLEYALLREEGKVRETTPIATTVHPLQIVAETVATYAHDIPVDFLVTPSDVIAARPGRARPRGIYWDLLRQTKINNIPLLRKRLSQLRRAGRPA